MKRARDECNPRMMLRNQYAASLWKLHAFFLFLHAIIRILRPFLIRRLRLLPHCDFFRGFFFGRLVFSRIVGTGRPSPGWFQSR